MSKDGFVRLQEQNPIVAQVPVPAKINRSKGKLPKFEIEKSVWLRASARMPDDDNGQPLSRMPFGQELRIVSVTASRDGKDPSFQYRLRMSGERIIKVWEKDLTNEPPR